MWGGRVIRAHVRPAGQRARRRGVVSVRAQPPGAGARVGSSTFPACAANTAASRPTEQASADADAPPLPVGSGARGGRIPLVAPVSRGPSFSGFLLAAAAATAARAV